MYVPWRALGFSSGSDILQVHIRKVKLLKQPKFDLGALLNLHGESTTDEQGQKVEREFKEQVLESV
jgi:small subunit ribosomal protein S3Ae